MEGENITRTGIGAAANGPFTGSYWVVVAFDDVPIFLLVFRFEEKGTLSSKIQCREVDCYADGRCRSGHRLAKPAFICLNKG